MRWALFFLSLFVLAGCNKESVSTSNSPSPKSDSEGNTPQVLKLYDGDDQNLNVFQAVNASPGKLTFDFTYEPLRDQVLTLPVFGVKSYLIGCKDSDVSISFQVFQSGPDGQLTSPTPFPVAVEQGLIYILRVNLNLKTSCLGLRYNFAVQSSL